MDDRERVLRILVVTECYEAFGIDDPKRALGVVKLTAGIPWLVPAVRGEEPTGELLFPRAVSQAAMSCTHGPFTPAHIMEAAIELGGRVRSESGNMSDKRWVKAALAAPAVIDEKYTQLEAPEPTRRIGDGL